MSHTTRQALNIRHLLFCGFFCLFVVIGLPTLFLGCNPNVDHMCMAYNVVHGTTYGIKDETKTCQDCESKPCGENACQVCGDSYTCYRGIVQLNYGDANDNCEYKDRKKTFRTAQARDDYYNKKYPIGSTHNFIMEQRGVYEEDGNVRPCRKIKKGMETWTVGVVFICFAGVTLLGWITFGWRTYPAWKANVPAIPASGVGNGTYVANNPSPYAPVNTHVEMISIPSNSHYPAVTAVTPYPGVDAYPTSAPQRPTSVPITPTVYATAPAANSSPYNSQYTPTHVAVSAVGAESAVNAAVRPQSTPVYAATISYPSAAPYSSTIPITNSSSVAARRTNEEYDMY